MKRLITAAALLAAAIAPAAACELGDVTVLQSEFRSRDGGEHGFFVTVVGELESSCATASIVRVHLTWRDADGHVVGARETYVENIPPHGRLAFEVPDTTIREAKSMDTQVTGIRPRP